MWTSCKPWYFQQNWEINTSTLRLAKLFTFFGFQSGFPEIFFSVPRSHLGSYIAFRLHISLVFSDLWMALSLCSFFMPWWSSVLARHLALSSDLSVTTVSGLDRGCGFLVRTPKSWSPLLLAPYGGAGGIHTTWLVVFFITWLLQDKWRHLASPGSSTENLPSSPFPALFLEGKSLICDMSFKSILVNQFPHLSCFFFFSKFIFEETRSLSAYLSQGVSMFLCPW